ncbi:membrane protein [Bacillus sp. SA1-12]|uniref:YitT family protein n=1 Tax=Bacillus sp. SA1-12 TaxID=1455638 RepID=UPI000626F7BA|nr:YitT family protein [Bacillus sp. SA1-12]KKI90867.1 membrane protein [Bacillus sp. SA1-12]
MNLFIQKIAMLLAGSFIYALGINYFAIPNKLSEGGIIGITIIVYYLLEWSPGIVNLILNGLLFALGYKLLDKKTILFTLLATVFSSFFLYLTEGWGESLGGDTLLAALFAGVFVGGGLGLVFRAGGAMGGTAILARLGHYYFGWSLSRTILIIDLIMIAGSVYVIGQEKAMYTLVAVFVGAKVIDLVLEGLDSQKAVTIISSSADKISTQITLSLARGVTVFNAKRAYTGSDKEVLYVVINRQELAKLKQLVRAVDANAFVVVHEVRDVIGGGFSVEKA